MAKKKEESGLDIEKIKEAGVRIGTFTGVGGITHVALNYASRGFLNYESSFVQRFGQLGFGATIAGLAYLFTRNNHKCFGNAMMAGAAPTIGMGFGKAFKSPDIVNAVELHGGYTYYPPSLHGNPDGPLQLTFSGPEELQAFIAASTPAREIPVLQGEMIQPWEVEYEEDQDYSEDALYGDPDEMMGDPDELMGDPDEMMGDGLL